MAFADAYGEIRCKSSSPGAAAKWPRPCHPGRRGLLDYGLINVVIGTIEVAQSSARDLAAPQLAILEVVPEPIEAE